MEYQVDFQAFALDRAGNIGFSDADPTSPRFINDLGQPKGERTKAGNVLGYFSAHIITLDEKDPGGDGRTLGDRLLRTQQQRRTDG